MVVEEAGALLRREEVERKKQDNLEQEPGVGTAEVDTRTPAETPSETRYETPSAAIPSSITTLPPGVTPAAAPFTPLISPSNLIRAPTRPPAV